MHVILRISGSHPLTHLRYYWLLPLAFLILPLRRPSQPILYEITPGKSILRIQHELFMLGFQPFYGAMLFKLYWNQGYKRLKAGEYILSPDLSFGEMIDRFLQGKRIIHKITIPEGYTVEEAIQRMSDDPLLRGKVEALPPEGSCLPTTIYYLKYADRSKILRQFQHLMEQKLEAIWKERSIHCHLACKEELLVLASIVEKETSLPQERDHIAGVFLNRLKKGMPLQADPTIAYSEKIQSPQHNTYLYKGLPPTPICCPGEASLRAVAQPKVTRDYYFVTTGQKGHRFSETYQEHRKNIARWKKSTSS